jgi:hypothetical protein
MLKLTPTTNDQLKNGGTFVRDDAPTAQITRLREPELGVPRKRGRPKNKPETNTSVEIHHFLEQAGHVIAPVIADQSQQVVFQQPLKIALIGTAPSSRMLAPFGDPTWKIWACSPGNQGDLLPRIDAWFEIHGNMLWPENKHYGAPYLEWLKKQTFPVYMQSREWVPQAIPLPIDELVAEFGP